MAEKTCKACFHYKACKEVASHNGYRDISYTENQCNHFLLTADYAEVKHGEWIRVQYTYFGLKRYECSECKDDEYWQKRYLEHKEKYCPNCGARMDGLKQERNEEDVLQKED